MRRIVVWTSDKQVKHFGLKEGINLIGRAEDGLHPEIDLSTIDPDSKVSRKHAQLNLEGEKLLLEDLSSLNGTFLINPGDGSQTKLEAARKYPLRVGDKFTVGALLFVVEGN